ncbi:MAG: preprotein translocase subunit YajC [Bacteroidales bacterium]|nr:preprotein translocase subunit YajC [Bacteroidales bacterium]
MNNLLILLQAAEQATEQAPSFMQKYGSLFFIVLLIVVFWLFFIRPQSKKAKEEQKYRESLQKGDKVVTIGGLHGKVVEVKETTVIISLSPNNEVEVEKSALVQSASRVGQA